MKVWGRAGIELATPGFATPGSAARLAYVARHVTDYIFVTIRLSIYIQMMLMAGILDNYNFLLITNGHPL